jgi:anti-sigma factor RsiW
MIDHAHFEELLPFYAAGQLDKRQREEIKTHLASCQACHEDLELWQSISSAVNVSDRALTLPANLADQALEQIGAPSRLAGLLNHAWQLLRAQAFLARREMWPVTATVLVLAVIAALLSKHVEAVYFLVPAVAVASVAGLTGSGHDPAYELTLATPTSPWKVLLARLSVVSVYNLVLSIAATLALLAFIPPALLGSIILGWLGPLAFLSALALLLSLWLGTSNALAIAYVLWIAQYIPYQSIQAWMNSPAWGHVILAYQQFWHSPILLCLLAIILVGISLWSVDKTGFRPSQPSA